MNPNTPCPILVIEQKHSDSMREFYRSNIISANRMLKHEKELLQMLKEGLVRSKEALQRNNNAHNRMMLEFWEGQVKNAKMCIKSYENDRDKNISNLSKYGEPIKAAGRMVQFQPS